MKYLVSILTLMFFISCNPKKDQEAEVAEEKDKVSSEDVNPHDFSQKTGDDVVLGAQTLLAQTDEGFKTFKSLNFTYAKLTGINPKEVDETYQIIASALPSREHPQFFTKFHPLAASRLADEYCHLYIERNKLGVNLSTATPSQIANKMVDNFLDEENPGDYNYVREELMPILKNDIIDANGAVRFIDPNENGRPLSTEVKNQRLSKLACTALFASYVIAGNASLRNFGN